MAGRNSRNRHQEVEPRGMHSVEDGILADTAVGAGDTALNQ